MQELIDYIDHMQNVYIKKSKETKDKNYQKGVEAILTATTLIKIQAKDNLEKEKEQLDDMFEEGFESAYQHFVNGKDFVQFEKYYNQTYNQKQHIIDIMKADEDNGLYNQNES